MEEQRREPADQHMYNWISLHPDTLKFFLEAVKFYISVLERDVDIIRKDQGLQALLDEETLKSFEIYKELERSKKNRVIHQEEFRERWWGFYRLRLD